MKEVELVIKIPEEVKQTFDNAKNEDLYGNYYDYNSLIGKAIQNGIQLPKGHGRIGDLDKIADRLEILRDGWNYYGNEFESGMYKGYDYALDEVMDAPTIIEKDDD